MEAEDEQSSGEDTPPISDGPFSPDIPEYGQTLRFDGLADFQVWSEKEHSVWSRVPKFEGVVGVDIVVPLKKHKKFFKNLSVDARDWRENDDEVRREAAKTETITAVETLLRGETLPLTGLLGRRFLKLVDDDPLISRDISIDRCAPIVSCRST